MRWVVGLLAMSLIGAKGSEGPDASDITYQFKIVEVDGLGWRSSLHSQLQPVKRQGTTTVWTCSRVTADKLALNLLTENLSRVTEAPKVTANAGAWANIMQNSTRKVVTEVSRQADGPVNHASFVGYVPQVEDASEGFSVRVKGRSIDQGVLANVVIEASQITAVHSVPLKEVLEVRKDGKDARTGVEVAIQVPEYARSSVSGEWMIPSDGVLLVSLGTHTVADSKGLAVVREKIAIIEAAPVSSQSLTTAARSNSAQNITFETLSEIPMPFKPAPAVPSRSLPLAFKPGGIQVDLPPLPDDPAPEVTMPGSSEPCATSQGKVAVPVTSGEPIPWKKSGLRDLSAERTRLDAEQELNSSNSGVGLPPIAPVEEKVNSTPDSAPKTFRVPLSPNLFLEIRAKATSRSLPNPPEPTPFPGRE